MDRYQKLEQITNGINAAYKIRSAGNLLAQRDSENRQEINNVDLLIKMLSVIAEYSPESHRDTFNENLQKSTLYHNTYRNLKQHIKNIQSNRHLDSDGLAKTLEIVKPILTKDRRNIVEKMLQIHEIIKSWF